MGAPASSEIRSMVNAYLTISRARDDAAVIGKVHELCVEHVIAVARVEREGRQRLLPVPQRDGPVVRPGEEQAPVRVEAQGVDAAPVLPQPLLYVERMHKVLRKNGQTGHPLNSAGAELQEHETQLDTLITLYCNLNLFAFYSLFTSRKNRIATLIECVEIWGRGRRCRPGMP
jgi:hypothetical protein